MSGSWGRRVLVMVSGLLFLTGLALGGAVAAGAAQSLGQVFVVHAIDGAKVDVVVDGKTIAPGAAPKTVVGPLRLTAGDHVLELRQQSTVVTSARFTVVAGQSIDVVAHRTADAARTPTVTVFRNDLSAVAPGKSRLVVSHVAVSPPADIRVDGKPLFRNVANGESLSLVVPAKTYSIDVVPTATTGPVILAPVRLKIEPGTLTRVFAIGDPANKTADAIVQVLAAPVVGASRPTSVHTGDGGQAADSFVDGRTGLTPWAVTCLAIGLAGLLLSRRTVRVADPLARSRHAR